MSLSEEKRTHVQYRLVSRTLEIITKMDSSPLTVKRSLDRRFLRNCRDFSVFLCSVLREQGIPARARCGFETYFCPGGFEDHWVCEYWNGERWVMVDAQLDEFQRKTLRIDFDPLNMPRGKFIHASEAWLMCRNGLEDPDKFGIFDMHGLWFRRLNVVPPGNVEISPGAQRSTRKDVTFCDSDLDGAIDVSVDSFSCKSILVIF